LGLYFFYSCSHSFFLSFGVFAFLMHRFGDPSVFDLFTLRNITIYLLIGFVYGLIRSAHLGRTAAIDFKNKEILDQLKREEFRESSWLKIKNKLKGNFLRWWTLWFISGPIWMTSKFFSLMWDQLKEIPISIAKYFFDLQTKK